MNTFLFHPGCERSNLGGVSGTGLPHLGFSTRTIDEDLCVLSNTVYLSLLPETVFGLLLLHCISQVLLKYSKSGNEWKAGCGLCTNTHTETHTLFYILE